MLRAKIARRVPAAPERAARLAVTFMSFGFKHGPPREEDLLIDVRFLANPHYEPELRELTGTDRAWSSSSRATGAWRSSTRCSIRCWTSCSPQYVAEGKAHLVIAIGCTGGRHRSVAIAEHLAERYATQRGRARPGRAPRRRQAARGRRLS
jgi:UPF0042 nucleotide-binding protein